MSLLTISLKIPFETDSSVDFGSQLIFTSWFPNGLNEGIKIADGDMAITLWFDESCVPSNNSADELKRYSNLGFRFVRANVQLLNISGDLLAYMQGANFSETTSETPSSLTSEYAQLARQVLTAVIKRVNRLTAGVRTIKGQHWLKEQTLDHFTLRNTCLSYACSGRVDDGKAFSFAPPISDSVFVRIEGEDRYICETDWPKIRDFVISEGKTDLIRELLAGAERLADEEHYRASLTEAVTAMEIAVSAFSRDPKADQAFGSCMARRLSVSSLAAQVKHLGISGTINYLLPVIISEEILSASTLVACQAAIQQRQTVVHQGQREVSEGFAKCSLKAIRQLCNLLESLSLEEDR
jgi:hypothetical protein